jgi:hypothetical protein
VSRSWLALLFGSITVLFTLNAAAEEPLVDAPAPFVAEYPQPSARGTLAIAGGAIFAAWYGAAIGQSFLWPDAPEAKQLRIPVVGPWLTIANAGCSPSEASCEDLLAITRAILAGVTAIGQVGGLAALTEAAFLRTASGERAPAPRRTSKIPSVSFVAGEQGVGIGLSGAF